MKNWIRGKILKFLFPDNPFINVHMQNLINLQKSGVDVHSLPLREVARQIGIEGKPQIVKHHLAKLAPLDNNKEPLQDKK